MDWGMKNRFARIVKPEDGRAVMLAVDHGYFLGPTSGLEQPRKTIEPLLPYADSLMLTRGVLRTSVEPNSGTPIVLRVSGGTSILKELSNEDITVSIEEAIRLNVSAMALSIFVGSEYEKETLVSLARLVRRGRALRNSCLSRDGCRQRHGAGCALSRSLLPHCRGTRRAPG